MKKLTAPLFLAFLSSMGYLSFAAELPPSLLENGWATHGDFTKTQEDGSQKVVFKKHTPLNIALHDGISILTLEEIYIRRKWNQEIKLQLFIKCPVQLPDYLNPFIKNCIIRGSLSHLYAFEGEETTKKMVGYLVFKTSRNLNNSLQFFYDSYFIPDFLVTMMQKTLATGGVNLGIFKKPTLTASQIRLLESLETKPSSTPKPRLERSNAFRGSLDEV